MNKMRTLLLPIWLCFAALASCSGGGGSGSSGNDANTTQTDLEIVSVSGAPASAAAGDSFTVTVTIRNNGPALSAGAAVFPFFTVSSRDNPFDAIALDAHIGLGTLAVVDTGASVTIDLEAMLPSNLASGTYFFGVGTYNGQTDSNLANNIKTSTLMVQGTTCSEDAFEPDDTFAQARSISLGVPQARNHCLGTQDWVQFTASAGVSYGIATSDVGSEAWTGLALYDSTGSTLLTTSATPPDWNFYAARMAWTAPASGIYFVRSFPILGAHSSGANTGYNLTVAPQNPDLVVQSPWVSGTAHPGGQISVIETVFNQGFAAAGAFEVGIYLSADATLSVDDTLLGTRNVDSLAVGSGSSLSYPDYNYILPSGLATATYYVFVVADRGGVIGEMVESNNISDAIPVPVTP